MQGAASARWMLRGRRILTPQGEVDGGVIVSGERIEAVLPAVALPTGILTYDAADLVVMPGVVDTHVHVNEPGRTEWEGYETAGRAAAAGGITTLVDMPLNCTPVTTSVKALAEKLTALAGKLTVDCGFYGGIVPGNEAEIAPLVARGVLGFKAFLVHSGIDDFPNVVGADLDKAMPEVARAGVPLLVHAELAAQAEAAATLLGPTQSYARYLSSRPCVWENAAVALMIDKCRATGCRVHVVHLSSASAAPLVEAARLGGLPVTAETCPHYLTFTAEEIADGDTRFKCAPPIRERANREQLWHALTSGAVDCVVSDHSPCAPHLKHLERGDFDAAWGGVAGLQFSLAATWTGARERGIPLARLVSWMCERPAALVGLEGRKGRIAPGADADLIVLDPDKRQTVRPESVWHRSKLTPYEARPLWGVVEATFVRGGLVYERGRFLGGLRGRPLLKGAL